MPYFSWVAQEQELSAAALTVRAQTIPQDDQGRLLWNSFFPRRDVDSIKLNQIAQLDFRPVSDRREWNARGRLIHLRTPNLSEIEMIPVEAYFKVAEREIQELTERTLGNEALFRQIIGASIPDRIDTLAEANFRRIEYEAMRAWALGEITTRNPVTNATETVDFGFDAARYEVAATAWNDAGVNAYDLFLAWLTRAIDLVGPIRGVMLRLATLNAIKADAPNPYSPTATIQMTRAQLAQRIQDELGSEFTFYVNESTVDVYTDGGLATTRTKVWPAEVIAAIPAGETVGYTAFAPVARAFEIARQAPQAEIDVRGQTAFLEVENGGRGLTVECQVNALTIPEEARIATVDAGV